MSVRPRPASVSPPVLRSSDCGHGWWSSAGRRHRIEMRFTLQDPWSARLLIALCRRWGLQPFRYPRQRQTTVIVRAPREFLERVLWPRFQELHDDMKRCFERTTDGLIRRAIFEGISDAPLRPEPRQRR